MTLPDPPAMAADELPGGQLGAVAEPSPQAGSDPVEPSRLEQLRAETLSHLRTVATAEAMLGAVIMALWTMVATGGIAPAPLVLAAVIVGLALHFSAVDTGNFVLLWMATGWVLLAIVGSARSVLAEANALVFTLGGLSALAHNELIRVGYARRRNAVVDASVHVASAVGVGLAGLVSVIAIGFAEPLSSNVGVRSWLWMPIAVLVVAAVVAAFAIVPTWRAPSANKDRWQPGERIPAHRSEEEAGS